MSGISTVPESPKRAVVIGAGFGGLSMALRLQSLGFQTTIVEALCNRLRDDV